MNKKIIWIEDEANDKLSVKRNYVLLNSDYELTLAFNTSEAEKALSNDVFDAIIVDVRLPPGEEKKWNKIYDDCLPQRKYEIMGLKLVKEILAKESSIKPANKAASKIGLFTVEYWDALESELTPLGLKRELNYFLKEDAITSEDFLNFINSIVSRNDGL